MHYRKPPITEAVIAFHFGDQCDARARERFTVKRKKELPRVEELRDVKIVIGPQLAVEQTVTGSKFTSDDGLHVVILTPSQMSVCQLGAYSEWSDLLADAKKNWETLIGVIGRPELKAISTRYMNRIDIRSRDPSAVDPYDYFNLQIKYPSEDLTRLPSNFFTQIIAPTTDGRFQHNINFGSSTPVLVDHVSFLLDIDTWTIEKMPGRLEEIWQIVDELHGRKNSCFESCITDKARDLFK